MKHSAATIGRMALDDYVDAVPHIYGAHDAYRSIWDVWCHTLHHGAAVAERIRKGAPPEKLFVEIADLAVWLFTTVQRLYGRPGKRKTPSETPVETLIRTRSKCSDALWHRYPGVCHLCYARRTRKHSVAEIFAPCDCQSQEPDHRDKETKRADQKALRDFSNRMRKKKPRSIDDWQTMFGTIFARNIEVLSTVEIGFHLLEELGEASDAMIRMYSYSKGNFVRREPNWRQARLEDQIADVFSWLFSLVEKLNAAERFVQEGQTGSKSSNQRESGHITLSGIVWSRYGRDRNGGFRCPCCDSAVCSCQLIFVPGTHSVKELLGKFEKQK